MIHHITYTSENMTTSAALCMRSALDNGCDQSYIYMEQDLNTDFRTRNADILAEKRGAGYWIWKPQIILQEMEKAAEGDIIIYTDAGVEIINSVNWLIREMDDWYMLFGGQYRHFDWCKGDCLPISDKFSDSRQLQASVVMFKCCDKAKEFIKDWIRMCEQDGFIDDSPTTYFPNDPAFREHRHDQALLTTIQLNRRMKSHYWPASYLNGQFNYPKNEHTDNYPIIFNHHRKRNDEW